MEENKKDNIIKTMCIAVIFSCISVILTCSYFKERYENNLTTSNLEISESAEENIDELAKVLKGFRKIIDENYVGDVDEDLIVEETIKGYINGLGDEYSEYMTADEWDDFQTNALGNYVGIGIYMSQDKNGNIVVVSPIEGSPAEDIGILSEDIIVEVNDESVIGLDTEEVANRVKGEEGTKVKIKILRKEEYLTFEVERKAIKIYKVKSEMLESNIGYIQLSTFDDGCSTEFENEFKSLKSKGAKKLIIDLRNNTGGLVNEALKIADMILPKGDKMLITLNSKDEKDIEYSENAPIIDMDIIVLTNEYSASASEILVGALKDNGKAKSIGKKTYGKGVIQTVLTLNDGSVLKLTTAEYYTPNESKINKIGIDPDVEVEEIDDEDDVDEQLNAAIELLK